MGGLGLAISTAIKVRSSRINGVVDVTAPTLSSPTAAANGATGGYLGVTTNEGNGALYWVVTTSATPPTALQVKTGKNDTGAAAVAAGSQSIATSGVKAITATGLTASTVYYSYFMHEDASGNRSTVAAAASFTTGAAGDVTAPTLTSPTGSGTGATTATIGVTTDEANGTLYAVLTTSSTPPSKAQVKAGQNNAGTAAAASGSLAISSTGAKSFNATGLTASTTYYAYFMHEDAAGNQSNVAAAASFATPATSFTQPTITQTSAAGTNPPTFDSSMPDLLVGDTIELYFTTNGVDPVAGTPQETHIADAREESIVWSTFGPFTGGATVKWAIRYGRGGSWSLLSNILTDTMAAAAFSPSSLYGVGDVGYAYDTTDLSKVWQNNDGTGAGAFTSVVGKLIDQSGLNNHPVSETGFNGTRPVLQNVASGMLKFDGVDDRLTLAPCLWAGGSGTVIMAVKGPTQDGAFVLAETKSNSSSPVWAPGLRTNVNQDVLFYHRNDSNTATAVNKDINVFDDAVHIYCVTDDGATVTMYVDGAQVATHSYTSRASLGTTTIDQAHLGCARVGGANFNASPTAYLGSAIIIDRVLTGPLGTAGTEFTKAYNWVAAKHGKPTL